MERRDDMETEALPIEATVEAAETPPLFSEAVNAIRAGNWIDGLALAEIGRAHV